MSQENKKSRIAPAIRVTPELYDKLRAKVAREGKTVAGITRDFWQVYVSDDNETDKAIETSNS